MAAHAGHIQFLGCAGRRAQVPVPVCEKTFFLFCFLRKHKQNFNQAYARLRGRLFGELAPGRLVIVFHEKLEELLQRRKNCVAVLKAARLQAHQLRPHPKNGSVKPKIHMG